MSLKSLCIKLSLTGATLDELGSHLWLLDLCLALARQFIVEISFTSSTASHASSGHRIAFRWCIHYCRFFRSKRISHVFIKAIGSFRRWLLFVGIRLGRLLRLSHVLLLSGTVCRRKTGAATCSFVWRLLLKDLIIILKTISWVLLIILGATIIWLSALRLVTWLVAISTIRHRQSKS